MNGDDHGTAAPAQKPDDEAIGLLRMIYVAAVYAVETHAYMLGYYEGLTADQRRKLELCRRLEAAGARRLRNHLEFDLGLKVRPPRRARQAAQMLATLVHGSWAERMAEEELGAIRGVACFRTLKALYGQREPELCAWLLAKEMALRDFARDELDGESAVSEDRITALLKSAEAPASLRGAA